MSYLNWEVRATKPPQTFWAAVWWFGFARSSYFTPGKRYMKFRGTNSEAKAEALVVWINSKGKAHKHPTKL